MYDLTGEREREGEGEEERGWGGREERDGEERVCRQQQRLCDTPESNNEMKKTRSSVNLTHSSYPSTHVTPRRVQHVHSSACFRRRCRCLYQKEPTRLARVEVEKRTEKTEPRASEVVVTVTLSN